MLETSSYSDEKYLILNETLISLNDRSETLVIPAEVNGYRIRRIGGGVYAGDSVKTIMISEGIEEIGVNAFCNSENLEKVILPESLKIMENGAFNLAIGKMNPPSIVLKRSLSKADYEMIWSNSIPLFAGQTRLLTPGFDILEEFADICSGFGFYRKPRKIDKAMKSLYFTTDMDAYKLKELKSPQSGKGSLVELPFQGTPVVRQTADDCNKDFRKLYVDMLLHTDQKWLYDKGSEENFERAVRVGAKQVPSTIFLMVYDENSVIENNGRVSVAFRVMCGYAFFGDLTKVVYQGKDDYVSREKYLNPEVKHIDYDYTEILHIEHIVDAEGNVPDADIREMVAVKYKLPLILS